MDDSQISPYSNLDTLNLWARFKRAPTSSVPSANGVQTLSLIDGAS